MSRTNLDEIDERILRLVSGNARIPFLEIARECNVSGAAIHQRIQRLINIGVIKGSSVTIPAPIWEYCSKMPGCTARLPRN